MPATRPNDFQEPLQNSHASRIGSQPAFHLGGMYEMLEKPQQYAQGDVAALETQVEQLKQAIVLLQAQLADMREQKDKWQCRAERVSLVAGY